MVSQDFNCQTNCRPSINHLLHLQNKMSWFLRASSLYQELIHHSNNDSSKKVLIVKESVHRSSLSHRHIKKVKKYKKSSTKTKVVLISNLRSFSVFNNGLAHPSLPSPPAHVTLRLFYVTLSLNVAGNYQRSNAVS